MIDSPALLDVAAALADGTAVDWDSAAQSATSEEDRRLLAELRFIARIARSSVCHSSGSLPHVTASSDVVPTGAPPPRSDFWGPLRLLEHVGRGSFGDVYRAWDTRLDREVALKLLRRSDRDDDARASTVIQEGRLLARVRHSNVVTVYGAERIDGQVGVWMEFIHGQTLEQELRERGPFEVDRVIGIGIDLADALTTVHRAGLIHGDVKTHNVMCSADGRTVLTDFGAGFELDKTIVAESRDLAGTPVCLAPEVFAGRPATPASDVYSLGVLLYHLVTGAYPVRGGSVREIREAHATGARTPLAVERPDLPSAFVRIVDRALDPNPENRYGSPADLGRELASLQAVDVPSITTPRQRTSTAGASLAELLAAHARGSQPDVRVFRPEISKSLANVVKAALSPQPDRRPATAQDLGNALEAAAARPRAIGGQARRVAAAAAVLAVVVGGFAASRAWLDSTRREPSAEARTPPVSAQALAVLPFMDLKPASDTSYLSFSLADALITHLSGLGALDVRAAAAIYKYRGATTTPKQVAEELRVGRVITGTYVGEGDSLRVTTEMIDAVNDVLLYKEAFEVSNRRLAAVADQVARHVVEALHMSVSPRENAAWQADVSRDPVAYELFLRGRDDYEATRRDSGAAFFERAVAIEPTFARAWAYLGSAYAVNASLRFGGRADYDRSQRALETALRLDPSDIVPRLAMANVLIESNRVEDAVPLLRGVMKDAPRSADVLWELAYAYRFAGLVDESVSAGERGAAMEPFALGGANIPLAQLYRGEYQRFLDGFRLDAQSAYQQFYTGLAHYYLKRFPEAALAFDHAYSLDQSMLHTRVGKALSLLISGDRNAAGHVLQLTELESTEREVSDAEALFRIAEAYAVLGDTGGALRVLGRSIEGGFFCYPYLARDPLLESIRSVPAFQSLLERARERHEAFRRRFF